MSNSNTNTAHEGNDQGFTPACSINTTIDWVRSGLAQAMGRLNYMKQHYPDVLDDELRAIHDTLIARMGKVSRPARDATRRAEQEREQKEWLARYLARQHENLITYVENRNDREGVEYRI